MKNRTGFLFSILLLCSSMVFAQQPQQSPTAPAAAPTTSPTADVKNPAQADKPEPPKDKAFADVVKDAQVIKGLFTLYRTDEKVFLEILPEQLE